MMSLSILFLASKMEAETGHRRGYDAEMANILRAGNSLGGGHHLYGRWESGVLKDLSV